MLNAPVVPSSRFVTLLSGPLVAGAMLALPPMSGMPPAAWKATAVAAWMAIWWVTEAVPLSATALLPLVLLPLLGILPVQATAAPYSNPVIFLFLGGFLLAAAFEASGLHRRLALAMIARSGTRPDRIIAAFMVTAAFISLWVSNTATTLMLYPLALSVLDQARATSADGKASRDFEVALLLAVAYAATIGGLGTLIGTPPNALLAAYMLESHQVTIPFVRWMLYGVPIVIVALPITWWLLARVLYRVPVVELPLGREAIAAERARLGPMRRAEVTVAVVGSITALAWMFQPLLGRLVPALSDSTISVAAGLALLVIPIDRAGTRTLTWEQAERIPWGVLILFGGGLAVAAAIQDSGLAQWIGAAAGGLRDLPPVALIFSLTLLVVVLTEFTSNTATAATFLPIVASMAVGAGVDPLVLAAPAALAATSGFMLPAGTPPNAIIYASGRLAIRDMLRAGIWVDLLLTVVITIATLTIMRPALGLR